MMSRRLVLLTLLMSLALIGASSIMHLANVGMGSMGWPDTYGHIERAMEAGRADTAVAAITSPTVVDRVHRAVANILELLIIAVLVSAFRQRRSSPLRRPLSLPLAALILSLLLAFLGAWYGSPLRYPWIMITNVTGGIALFSMFWWLTLDLYAGPAAATAGPGKIRGMAFIGLLLLAVVIVLGAWTDAFYAALACRTLPDCQGQWGSLAQLWQGLFLLGELGVDADGKVMADQGIAESIHMAHRMAAFAAFIFLGWLGVRAYREGGRCRRAGLAMLILLLIQVLLGIAAVLAAMPLQVVVLHTLFSALLVASVITLAHRGVCGRVVDRPEQEGG